VTNGAGSGFRLSTATPGTLGVDGVLDFGTAAPALQAMRAALAGGQVARLDLAGVSRSDSAGLACVIAALAEASRQGHGLQVVHMPAGMRALATVCEVEQLLS
jgi:phospholipid transport system transporter-binding protein